MNALCHVAGHIHISLSTLKSLLETFSMEKSSHLLITFICLSSHTWPLLHWNSLLLTLPNMFLYMRPHKKHPKAKPSLTAAVPHHSHRILIQTCQLYLWSTLQTHPCLIFTLTTLPKSPLLDPCSRLLPGLCSFFYIQHSSLNGL